MSKTMSVCNVKEAKEKIGDLKVYGDGDMWKLLCKASSQAEGWMKSTKAMEIEHVGCLVQVSTQQGDQIAEAVTFVPGVRIKTEYEYVANGDDGFVSDQDRPVLRRYLVRL